MTIAEYADIVDAELVIHRSPNQNNRYVAFFDRCEIMEDGGLSSECGIGATPMEAIDAYIHVIRGRRIVFDAMGPTRREYNVPRTLLRQVEPDSPAVVQIQLKSEPRQA